MLKILDSLVILLAGLMVGNEFTIAVFINPAFEKLSEEGHSAVVSPLAKLLGRVMPFWYASVILLTIADAVLRWLQFHQVSMPLVASAALWITTIIISVIWLVPLNNRVASWSGASLPPDWQETRSRWDRLHRFRVALLLAALVCLIVGNVCTRRAGI